VRNDPDLGWDEDADMGLVFPIEESPGVSHSGHETDHLFMNHEGEKYYDISPLSGLDDPADGRSWAMLDYDRDGWLDIAMTNANSPLFRLHRNRIGERPGTAGSGKIIAMRFVGGNTRPEPVEGLACRDGYGAKVRLDLGDKKLMQEHRCGRRHSSQDPRTVVIGIGANDSVREIEVEWPSGRTQTLENVAAGNIVTAYEVAEQSPTGEAFTVTPYGNPVRIAADAAKKAPLARLAIRDRGEHSARLTMFTTMATWCPTCKGELPQMTAIRNAFGTDELAMHGVPIDPTDDAGKLARYVDENQPAYDLLTDLSRGDVEAVEQVVEHTTQLEEALPATLVTDADGMVIHAQAGVPSISDLRRLLHSD
jgi:peroxiredoxin